MKTVKAGYVTDSILHADVLDGLKQIPDQHVHTVVTSPPYWGLRDYGVAGQIGLEDTPEDFVEKMVQVFREVRRVLRDDGTMWLNLGDSYAVSGMAGNWPEYQGRHTDFGRVVNPIRCGRSRFAPPAGLKPKDLVGIPWRVALALQADGWYLRADIIWHKPNPMPESVTDRPTKAHEYLFLLSKSKQYYYDADAIKEPSIWPGGPNSPESTKSPYGQGYKRRNKERLVCGKAWEGRHENYTPRLTRNRRSVWTVSTKPFRGAHFATFPSDLIEPCILAGCPQGGIVLDPFFGAGTVGVVALKHGRHTSGSS